MFTAISDRQAPPCKPVPPSASLQSETQPGHQDLPKICLAYRQAHSVHARGSRGMLSLLLWHRCCWETGRALQLLECSMKPPGLGNAARILPALWNSHWAGGKHCHPRDSTQRSGGDMLSDAWWSNNCHGESSLSHMSHGPQQSGDQGVVSSSKPVPHGPSADL